MITIELFLAAVALGKIVFRLNHKQAVVFVRRDASLPFFHLRLVATIIIVFDEI